MAKRKIEQPEVVAAAVPPESEWTLNGHPIPEHLQGSIPFAMTDQGYAAANAGKTKARVQVLRDAWDNSLSKLEDSIEPWETANPIQAAISRVRQPGMEYHLSSERVANRNGLGRWVPSKDENGNVVKVGNMTVCEMPKPMFDRMEQHYKDQAREALQDGINDFQVKQERFLSEMRQQGMPVDGSGPLAPGEMLKSWDSETQTSIGLHSSVGNSEI